MDILVLFKYQRNY